MTSFLALLPQILGSLALVIFAMLISKWQQVDLEQDMLIAVLRAFVQLVAIGYALEMLFESNSIPLTVVVISTMITIAGYTAGKRGHQIPHSQLVATIAIATAATLTLGTLLILQVFPLELQAIIPIAGMIIGNAMIATGVTMARLRDELKTYQAQIEAALALGATKEQASRQQLRTALMTGMTPIVDSTKTVGLISLPGAMTGLILAGVSPIEAVQIQIVVMYMLIGAAAFSSLTAAFLTYRQFFTKAHQLMLS